MTDQKRSSDEPATLEDRIDHVLTEIRVVLPGAQALLGFQLAIILLESFDQLPATSKYLHLASLSLIALTVILLMTPPAYHRIVERGEDTERFHTFASRMMLAAVVPLALGIAGDFFIVINRVTHQVSSAVVASSVMLALFYGLWFAFPLYRRASLR